MLCYQIQGFALERKETPQQITCVSLSCQSSSLGLLTGRLAAQGEELLVLQGVLLWGPRPSDPLVKDRRGRGLSACSGQRRARVLTERMLPGGRAGAQTASGLAGAQAALQALAARWFQQQWWSSRPFPSRRGFSAQHIPSHPTAETWSDCRRQCSFPEEPSGFSARQVSLLELVAQVSSGNGWKRSFSLLFICTS